MIGGGVALQHTLLGECLEGRMKSPQCVKIFEDFLGHEVHNVFGHIR